MHDEGPLIRITILGLIEQGSGVRYRPDIDHHPSNKKPTHLPGSIELVDVIHQVMREGRELWHVTGTHEGYQEEQRRHGLPHLDQQSSKIAT